MCISCKHTHTYTQTHTQGAGEDQVFCLALGNTNQECYFYELFLSVTRANKEGKKEGRKGRREGAGSEMNSLRLKELSNSDLYRRRQERPESYGSLAGERFR